MAFDCWLFGSLFRTLAVLCTQQRWPRVPGAAHGDRTDAGHDLALGQMPMAHQPLAAIIGELVGVAAEQGRDFGFNGLCQQRAGTVAQNLGQRIGKTSWMGEPENVSVGHGVSLLQWRSGGVKHPHDTPPYPFMPSPTFVHSSPLDGADAEPDGASFAGVGTSAGVWLKRLLSWEASGTTGDSGTVS